MFLCTSCEDNRASFASSLRIRIYMKLYIRRPLCVWTHFSLAHNVAAAALKDELAIGTVRTTRIRKQTIRPLLFFLSLLPLSLASVLVFNYRRCLPTSSNVFSIWGQLFTSSGFVPSRKKKQRTVYTLQAPFSPSLRCQRPVRPSPLADTLCVQMHSMCVCVFVSPRTDVCI